MISRQQNVQADPRFVFLAQASARYDLVQLREMGLNEAFDGLVPAFKQLINYESDFDRLVERIAKQNKARRRHWGQTR